MIQSGISDNKRRVLIMLAALGAAAYVVGAVAIDSGRLRDALNELGFAGCGLVLALSLINYLVRFGRWHTYIGRLGHSLPVWRHLNYYFSGLAFTVSPAKMGEAVRSVYLRRYGVTYTESIATLFVERLLDLLAIVLLASLMALDYPQFRALLFGALAIVVIALALVTQPIVPDWLEGLKGRVHRPRLTGLLAMVIGLMHSSRRVLHLNLLLVGVVLGLVAWGAEGIGFYVLCRGLHISIDMTTAVGIYSIAALAGSAAFFLPAGLGGMELVMTTLLVAQGAPTRVALVATLMCRLATLWFAVLLGVGATAVIELRAQPKALAVSQQ